MDIRQLETFVAVVENKSFTKAAELLYVSQPTVSNHISNLEKELDTIFFIRSKRNVSLTKAGNILYNHAKNIIHAYKSMAVELRSYNENMEGHLNIYASSVPRKFFLPSLLRDFSTDYPGISYSLLNDDSQSVIDGLMIGETDFGFVGMKVDAPKLSYHRIMDDELVFLTSNSVKSQSTLDAIISLDELKKHPLILREEGSGTRSLFETQLNLAGITLSDLNQVAIVEDSSTILHMVERGLGATIISKYEYESCINDYHLTKYRVQGLDLKRHFYFVYNDDMQYVPINKLFKNFVINKFK